ncbi:MAG TPA: FAD/NAD(P)-binding protein [Streptosporangiaceae bacterium]
MTARSTSRPGPGSGLGPRRGPVIAIIGGGASGTLAAIHLLREATARQYPLSIALIDRLGRHGLGEAYSTTSPAHFLNALTARMSGVAGDPDHLLRWAASAGLGGLEFLPRQAFGRYLQDTLADAERRAAPLSRLSPITSEVLGIRPGGVGRPMRVLLADGSLEADLAILATGNGPPSPPVSFPDSRWCITNPWAPGALDVVQDGRPVVILGSGLTMLDVTTVVTADPRTTVRAVSRHGMLPQVHRGNGGPADSIWLPVLSDTVDPVRLPELIWQVRSAMDSRPNHWQDVVDAVRPHVPSLWRRLPDRDKRLFVRHVARYWEVHRHRMPPATAQRITELRCTGRLAVLRGRVTGITEIPDSRGPERLSIRVDQDGSVTDLAAGWLINATGPGTDLTRTSDPLLRDLLARGLARPDPLRLGLDASPDGAVLDAAGTPSATLFTLGPPLRGIRYETTAIPEIRDQAAALAGLLTAVPQAREHPGSAA